MLPSRIVLFPLIGTTIILGTVTGFADFSKRAFFGTLRGQIVHAVLSIACFVIVGVIFWRFGWKMGVVDVFLVIIAANVRLML